MKNNVNRKRNAYLREIIFFVPLGFVLAFFLFPIFWMILNSLKSDVLITSYPPIFWFFPTLKNYINLLFDPQYIKYPLNSLVIAVGATGIALLVSAPASYVMARYKMSKLATAILTARMIPIVCYLIPWYILFSSLGLIDTHLGLIWSHLIITVPLTAWLLVGFFEEVPSELEEAGLIDGCTQFRAFRKIVLPCTLPGLVCATIISFTFSWNNLQFALVLTRSISRTLPVTILNYWGFMDVELGGMYASSTLMVIPIAILALITQKSLLTGLVGGLKE